VNAATAGAMTAARPHFRSGRDELVMRAGLFLVVAYLAVTMFLPLYAILSKSMEDKEGQFVFFDNFIRYFEAPGLSIAVWNSIYVSLVATIITIVLAFFAAYALTRTRMPGRPLARGIFMLPLLAPSLLPGISMIYLFGTQGILKGALFGNTIYGPIGIVIGEVLFCFPHALLIISTALANADQRHYEAALVLRASPLRTFLTVTLPGCRYGLISAFFVVFTLVFTDFGIPSVIGGNFPVLATEIYKQVIGRFDFQTGAVVGVLLLAPALLSFTVDRLVQRRQSALLTSGAVPLRIVRHPLREAFCLLFCSILALAIVGVMAMAVFASVIKFWPYNLSFTLKSYDFAAVDGATSWSVYTNSLTMAFFSATIGTLVIFTGAYLIEKMRGFARFRSFAQFVCMVPLAVPGLVLGLAFIFFFNAPWNPLNGLYGTMAILVICTITHFYTVPHLTALTSLKQIDREFESVSASLKVPFYVTFWRVTVPLCLPAVLNIWTYLFVSAMTTVSAVIFLYTAETKLAAVTIVNWNDSGKFNHAAALSVVITVTSALAWGLQTLLSRGLLRRARAWQRRDS